MSSGNVLHVDEGLRRCGKFCWTCLERGSFLPELFCCSFLYPSPDLIFSTAGDRSPSWAVVMVWSRTDLFPALPCRKDVSFCE